MIHLTKEKHENINKNASQSLQHPRHHMAQGDMTGKTGRLNLHFTLAA